MEKGKENVRLTSGKRKYNIIPKIMCLAAAFVLWLYVMQIDSVDTESTFTGVRVYLENTSEIESKMCIRDSLLSLERHRWKISRQAQG